METKVKTYPKIRDEFTVYNKHLNGVRVPIKTFLNYNEAVSFIDKNKSPLSDFYIITEKATETITTIGTGYIYNL